MTTTPARTRHRGWAVVRLARPWFWPLGWGGAYLGSVLATGALVPPPPALPRSAAALIVLGPLVWTAVLTVNDLYDLPTDRGNPRKANAPLVTGLLTPADLTRWHWGSVAAAVGVASAIGGAFLIGTAVVLILGWLYSVPPVRLKVGYETSAVRWRPESCYRAGVALWASATALWLAVCHLGVLVVRDSWWLQTLTAPLLVWLYASMARRPTIARMAVVVCAFAVPAGDFLLARVS
jgi:4-hydroxybenzoate polyprenyltransferase